MMYSWAAVEQAMKRQQILLRAMSGEITWIQAADILGISPRQLRRIRKEYESYGYTGLLDRRRHRPSMTRVPLAEVERMLRLYREKYSDFNVTHFVETVRRKHDIQLSYSFIKKALQEAGLVKKRRPRGRHRRRREPRACFGEMLHIDGSRHQWLALRPGSYQVLICVVDDATGRIIYAELARGETTEAILGALHGILRTHGVPMALYTDRAGWAAYTPKAGGKVDKRKLTQVGRVLKRLGVEHIFAYSPQARGRGERVFRTLQDRLVAELRAAGIRSVERANRYLREQFIARYNERFAREPADPRTAFVALGSVDLDQIICLEETRKVAPDNTIVWRGIRMQIDKQRGRRTCARLTVTVRQHLDHSFSVWAGPLCLGRYDSKGRPLSKPQEKAA